MCGHLQFLGTLPKNQKGSLQAKNKDRKVAKINFHVLHFSSEHTAMFLWKKEEKN
jgi:hypothetical protein